ncbi:hypothetical protein [Pelagibius sp. Alg239-R121]|uniref:hypothetical protein n=1 Tax=Pelagibius sp. Alg239-R121 TaxID=2993448 RepID=UPI0024A75F9C|nr:hypothetical protein [Pelagibius sp. Alg239-R121]
MKESRPRASAGGNPQQRALHDHVRTGRLHVFGLCVLLSGTFSLTAANGAEATNAYTAQLESAAGLATKQLLRAQEKDGLFTYDFDFLLGKGTGKNNIVRQAGAAYALGEAFSQQRKSELRLPLQKAVAALAGKSIQVGKGALVSFNGKRTGIKAGASALALLSELYYYRSSGDGRFAQDRELWLRALLALHRPGAGFLKSPDAQEESHYYNGEIWLALAFYKQTFDAEHLEPLLTEIDHAMMTIYGTTPHIGFFHWGAMAASLRFHDTGREELRHFALDQSRIYLTELRPRRSLNSNTCYSLEGLIPALALSVPESSLARSLEERIDWELRKNLALQIQPNQNQLDLGDETHLQSPNLKGYSGAFIAGRKKPFTRIDYTQHCLSAVLKYKRWQETRP